MQIHELTHSLTLSVCLSVRSFVLLRSAAAVAARDGAAVNAPHIGDPLVDRGPQKCNAFTAEVRVTTI